MKKNTKINILLILIAIIILLFAYKFIKSNNELKNITKENIRKTISVSVNNKKELNAYLSNFSLYSNNSNLSFLENYNNTSEIYEKNKERFKKIPFTKINGEKIFIDANILKKDNNFYFKSAKIVFLNENLELLFSKRVNINYDRIHLSTEYLPKDSNIYMYIIFEPNFIDKVIYNNHITYCAKIKL